MQQGGYSSAFETLDELVFSAEYSTDVKGELILLERLWLEKLRPYGDKGCNEETWVKPERAGNQALLRKHVQDTGDDREPGTMTTWSTRSCDDCGSEMRIREDWENPPTICKECRQKRADQWIEKPCEDCGSPIKLHRDWDKPPRFCKSCKEKHAARWCEVKCQGCGATIIASRDWDAPPRHCKDCKSANAPIDAGCDRCGNRFVISTGTQINCREKGWDLPKRCPSCRELLKHKPFKTIRETTLPGKVVFRTYNSRGQLVSESKHAPAGQRPRPP